MKRLVVVTAAAASIAVACKAEEPAQGPSSNPPRTEVAAPAPASGHPPLSAAELEDLKADSAGWKTALPGPDDVLAALEGLDQQAGAPLGLVQQIEPLTLDEPISPKAVALAAGVRVTDFFVYVHAKDARGAQGVTQDLLRLAERLGAAEEIKTGGKKVQTALAARDWARTKANMDDVYSGMRAALADDPDQAELADYVALGAWLQSVHLLSGRLQGTYAEAPARLLRQGFLAEFFGSKLKSSSDPWVRSLVRATTKLQAEMNVQTGQAVSQAAVQAIHAATTGVRDAV